MRKAVEKESKIKYNLCSTRHQEDAVNEEMREL